MVVTSPSRVMVLPDIGPLTNCSAAFLKLRGILQNMHLGQSAIMILPQLGHGRSAGFSRFTAVRSSTAPTAITSTALSAQSQQGMPPACAYGPGATGTVGARRAIASTC